MLLLLLLLLLVFLTCKPHGLICVGVDEFCSQFYEPEALLSDPADGRIFIELLGE